MKLRYQIIHKQSGNVLFIILLAIVLIGALTAVLQGTGSQSATIDKETLSLHFSTVRNYASELERGVTYIMHNGVSESDIRFAHPNADTDYGDLGSDTDKSDQMFHVEGGGAAYRAPPKGINDGSAWEFFGHSALPNAGSDNADLIAVLPNITPEFCDLINTKIAYSVQPEDSSTCLMGADGDRFDDGTQFSSSPNTTIESTFSVKPAMQGCVQCTSNNSLHFFHVIMAR